MPGIFGSLLVYQRHYNNTKTNTGTQKLKQHIVPFVYILPANYKGESLKTGSCIHEFNIRDYIFSSQITMRHGDTSGL
jgi:hypothetical protein